MFYLKYRPKNLDEIDSEVVRDHLAKIIKSEHLPHAFLFTGPKGVGKTSAARIIAKIINCDRNYRAKGSNTLEACNICISCVSVGRGQAPDVVEVDAASNRKIDDMRQLLSMVPFAPVYARYRVFIIDEVHMLTKESFNSILKTLEEPPAHTIFILATTELEKVPATIISRCIKIAFNRAGEKDIVRMLKRIAGAEKINADDSILETIAKYAESSFRDAAKLFEEAVISDKLNPMGITEIVGLGGQNETLLKAISLDDQKQVFTILDEYDQAGGNFKILIAYLLGQLRQHLLVKNGLRENSALSFSLKQTTCLIKLLHEANMALKYSPIEVLPLEVAMVEYFLENTVPQK